MKTKAKFRSFLAIASSSLLAISSASATTYTWTQTATGNQDWETLTNWSVSTKYVDNSSNELAFFTSITGVAGNATTVTSVPTTLSMNVLTLAGTGQNVASPLGCDITIGSSASTWTIGDGASTSTVNLTSTGGGSNADREIRYNVAANIALNGNSSGITTFTGAGTALSGYTFSGNITGSGKGITTGGGNHLLVFSGNNTYNGTTTVAGDTILRLSSANALPGGIGVTGGTSGLTINRGYLELAHGDFQRSLGTGSHQFQIIGLGSGFTASGAPRVVTVGNDANFELQWGIPTFSPSTLQLARFLSNNTLELANKIDLNGANRIVGVHGNKAIISGVIRNTGGTAAGLTKTGAAGTLILTGANTYNGTTLIDSGTLSIGAANNLGNGGSLTISGTLQITGTTLTSISSLSRSSVTFTATKAIGFDIQNAANTFTVGQVLNQGTGTLTKSGAGTLVLNQDNTFSGATTATGGGTLVLDYSNPTQNGSKLSDTAALNLNGSRLVLKGGTGLTEIVLSTGQGVNSGNAISRDGGDTKIALGTLTANTHANLTIADDTIATTSASTTVTYGILTQWGRVTVGSNFAARDIGNNIVGYSGYTPYTAGSGAGSALTVVNQLTGGGTMTSDLLSYALRIVNSANDDVLNMNSGVDLRVTNTSTILYGGGSNHNYTINGDGYLGSDSGNQAFNVNVFTGTLTVNARLTSGGSSSFAKAGVGTLVAGGANTYSGATYVQQGVLRLANNAGAGTSGGGVTVQPGAALELSQTTGGSPANITIGAEALTINGVGIANGGALRNHSGDNAYGGRITIGASGARINSNASSTLTLTGGIATTLAQDVTFGGAGNTTVSTTAISGSGNLIKDDAGTLTLSFANTYTGTTTINAGTLALDVNNALSSLSDVSIGGAATLQAGTSTANTIGTLDITGAATINLGTGANLVFADCLAVDWAEGTTLTITGTFVSGSSLRFGTTSSGLTQAQLTKISVAGLSNLSLDANGYLQGSFPGTLIQFF